ncbi:MAG: hypothetical protein AABX51_01770 [Nanoarchaeota archaeon]
MKPVFLITIILSMLLTVTNADAFLIHLNETHTETVAGKSVTVEFIAANTEENPAIAFFMINGNLYIFENATEQRIDDMTIAVGKITVSDDLLTGEAYVTILLQATCDDNLKNGDESDIDCGGSCGACVTGKICNHDYECKSRTCINGICASSASCTDGIKNSLETDVDCGGGCPKCSTGKNCNNGNDCSSGTCQNFICTQEQKSGNCFDIIKNNGEEGIDCGGSCQNKCITVRNASSICGVGCFFLNNDCVCPSGTQNQTPPEVSTENPQNNTIQEPQIETEPPQPSVMKNNVEKTIDNVQQTFGITNTTAVYFEDSRQVLISGTKSAKLFWIFPVKYKVEILVDSETGKVIKQSRPRWAVFAK